MAIPYFVVDAFTDRVYTGNPAAVCLLPDLRDDEWMQAVAGEMNLSETAFLLQEKEGYSLRWFTPKAEVDLCGHATLASAHVLWKCVHLPPDEPTIFHTRSGELTAVLKDEWIELNFPADPPENTDFPVDLLLALGVESSDVVEVRRGRFAFLVELASEALVMNLKPDMGAIERMGAVGTIVTSYSESVEFDFISRFFAPQVGVLEDPVTGAAHCCLGPYWQERLEKDTFLAYQASQRGGVVRVEVRGDRILLGGQAVTVAAGELMA